MSVSQIVPTTRISKYSKACHRIVGPYDVWPDRANDGRLISSRSRSSGVSLTRSAFGGCRCMQRHKRPKKKGGPRTGQSGRSTSSTLISSISCSIASSRGSIGDRDRDRSKGKGIAR